MPESDAIASRPPRTVARYILLWFLGSITFLSICAFIGSFFLDSVIRPRIEANMNGSLSRAIMQLYRTLIFSFSVSP